MNTKTLKSAFFVAMLSGLVAVVPDAAAQVSEPLMAVAVDSAIPADASTSPDALDLTGTWAQRLVQTTVSQVPVVGEVRNATTSLVLTTIEHDGESLTLRSRVCAVDVDSTTRMVRTRIPDAFVAALAEQRADARLVDGPGGPAIDGWSTVDVLGARLSDPLGDSLPDDEDDWRVMDPDRDGEPGVTVSVRGMVDGEIYLVQRGWTRWVTSTVDRARIAGHVEWASEQTILGASSIFLQSQPPTQTDPEPDNNRFELVRVAEDTSCAGIVESAETLFTSD